MCSRMLIKRIAFTLVVAVGVSLVSGLQAAPKDPVMSNKEYRMPAAKFRAIMGAPLAAPPPMVDHSWMAPPVIDDQNYYDWWGDQRETDCVAAAMGYYYRTIQGYMTHADEWTSTSNFWNQIDPGNLYEYYSGGVSFYFAGEALTQCTSVWYQDSGSFSSLGYSAFFTHRPAFNKTGNMIRPFRNNTDELKQWLAGTATKTSDCFALGIPVGIGADGKYAWDKVTTSSPVYQGDPGNEVFKKFRALCVVGYDANGFKCVNSEGPDWGANGFVWLPFSFVEKWAIEAWYLADAPAFLTKEMNPAQFLKAKGKNKVWDNGQYNIAYQGDGSLSVTSRGVTITNASDRDTLSIKRAKSRNAPEFVPMIPGVTIWSDKVVKKVYINGVYVGYLEVTTGTLDSLECVMACVGSIYARTVNDVRMMDSVNTTWGFLNPYDNFDILGGRYTMISTTDTQKMNVNLVGIALEGVFVRSPSANDKATILVSSKKGASRLAPPFASYGAVWGDILIGSIERIAVDGGQLSAYVETLVKGIGKLESNGMNFGTAMIFPTDDLRTTIWLYGGIFGDIISTGPLESVKVADGDMNADVTALGPIGSVQTRGGYINGGILSNSSIDEIKAEGGSIYSNIAAAGYIGAVKSNSAKINGRKQGGYIGNSRILAGWSKMGGASPESGKKRLGASDVGEVYAELELYNTTVIAGAVTTTMLALTATPELAAKPKKTYYGAVPNCAGQIVRVGAKNPYNTYPPSYGHAGEPSIQGTAWCKETPDIQWWQNELIVNTSNPDSVIYWW